MSKKRMFDKNERYNIDSLDLSAEITDAVRPIMDKYFERGYSVRDIAYVSTMAVNDVGVELTLESFAIKEK